MGTESTTISAKCGSSPAFEGDLDCSAAVSVGFVSALDGDGVDAVGYGDSGLCSSEWLLGGVVQRMHSGNLSPTAELLECCGCHAYRGDFATAPVKPLNVRTKT